MNSRSSAADLLTSFDQAARSFSALDAGRCDWCSSPFHQVYHSGLCRHCYEIRSEQRRLAKEVNRKWRKKTGRPWKALDLGLRIDCHAAGRMEDMARAEGQLIEHHRLPAVSSMTIEELLTYIGRALVHKDLYYNRASMMTAMFSPAQRESLVHLLSEAVDVHKRFNRRKRARMGPKIVDEARLPPDWLLAVSPLQN